MGLKHIIVLQNKIDLIPREKAQVNFREIKKFVQGTPAGTFLPKCLLTKTDHNFIESSPIIPISAQLKYNIDALCDHLTNYIPLPIRDFTQNPKMVVIRSFDVNNPGSEVSFCICLVQKLKRQKVDQLRGGVCGGSLIHGVLKLDQEIEIRPGVSRREEDSQSEVVTPIRTKIMSLMSDKNSLQVNTNRVMLALQLTYILSMPFRADSLPSAPSAIRLCVARIVWSARFWARQATCPMSIVRLKSKLICCRVCWALRRK